MAGWSWENVKGAAGDFGLAMSVAGIATQAIGAFYAVKSQQYQAKSQALTLKFQESTANRDARDAERDAQHILRAGQEAKGRVGLQYGQAKQAILTRQAAAGIQTGVGSAGEVTASVEYAKEADMITITKNSVRAANAQRKQVTALRNRALFSGLSARNLRSAASSMSGGWAAFSSLLGGAGQVAGQWARDERQRRYYEAMGRK